MKKIEESKTNTSLNVSVKSKQKVIYEGVADSISSINVRGVFDILPFHTNFVTLISTHIILDKGEKTEKKFELEKGVLYVMSNNVDVYVGI